MSASALRPNNIPINIKRISKLVINMHMLIVCNSIWWINTHSKITIRIFNMYPTIMLCIGPRFWSIILQFLFTHTINNF